jgi:hypothetical protein
VAFISKTLGWGKVMKLKDFIKSKNVTLLTFAVKHGLSYTTLRTWVSVRNNAVIDLKTGAIYSNKNNVLKIIDIGKTL